MPTAWESGADKDRSPSPTTRREKVGMLNLNFAGFKREREEGDTVEGYQYLGLQVDTSKYPCSGPSRQ